jgi:hypothetical protein
MTNQSIMCVWALQAISFVGPCKCGYQEMDFKWQEQEFNFGREHGIRISCDKCKQFSAYHASLQSRSKEEMFDVRKAAIYHFAKTWKGETIAAVEKDQLESCIALPYPPPSHSPVAKPKRL